MNTFKMLFKRVSIGLAVFIGHIVLNIASIALLGATFLMCFLVIKLSITISLIATGLVLSILSYFLSDLVEIKEIDNSKIKTDKEKELVKVAKSSYIDSGIKLPDSD